MAHGNDEQIDFKYNFKTYLKFLKPYTFLLAIIIVVVLLIEITNLVDKLFFKIIIDRGTEFLNGTLALNAYVTILLGIGAAYIVMIAGKSFGKWIQMHLLNRMDANLIIDLKKKFYSHIIHLSHTFHTTHKTGSLIARLTRGARGIEAMTDFIVFSTFPLLFQFIIVSASLLYVDLATGIVVICVAFVFIAYGLAIQHFQRRANAAANLAEDIEKGRISDTFTNIDSIKYFGKEEFMKRNFAKVSGSTRSAQLRHWDYFRWLDAGQSLILAIGTFFLIYFPLKGFLAHEITLGTLVFVYTLYGNLSSPLFGFMGGMRNFYRSMADFEDLFRYGKIENDIGESPSAKELKIEKGTIELRDISFRYHKRSIFKNFNLKIPANKKVALVGHSGSGKSTLVKLLYRFYDVNEGEILIDGKNIKEFKQESIRSELSIVPQECVLFDDTVYNNIAFSNPRASKEQVMKAMKFAQLDRVVATFPKKENTIVGERGVKLSGGEKQRVSIARAILADRKVLVLDEATSSLDSQTEHDIQAALKKLMQGRTSIIIAHRLSTIMHADTIVVLDKGKIVQMGSHNELIRKSGLYRKFWNLQRGGYLTDSGNDKE